MAPSTTALARPAAPLAETGLPGCAAAPRVRPGGVADLQGCGCRAACSGLGRDRNRRLSGGLGEPTHHSRLARFPKYVSITAQADWVIRGIGRRARRRTRVG
jgi:hypothetical protein